MAEGSGGGRKRKPLTQLCISNDLTLRKRSKTNDDQPRTAGEVEVKRAGNISRMVLKNFMCHSLLDVEFHSNISVLIGRNGSGKSAILTALVVGLGGKASCTSRGSSIKSFIKAGKSSCTVQIELYNGGPMAYRPGVYGEKITIVRVISASGGSSYKILGVGGALIATNAREVNNITMGLNIQIDNPICVLNQDTSRTFLSSSDPKNKYTLFIRATKLDVLDSDYKNINANKNESIRMLEEKQRNILTLKDDMVELKKKIESHNMIGNLQERVRFLNAELCWAKVRDFEEQLADLQAKLDQETKKYDILMNKNTTRSQKVDSTRETIADLNRKMDELRETIRIQSRPQQDAKRELDELRDQLNRKKVENQSVTATIQSKTRDAEVLQNEIANSNDNMSRAEQEKMQRMRDLKTMEEKIKGMDDHLQTCRNDLYQIRSDVGRKDEEKQNLKREIVRLDHQISNEKSSLNALTSESGNSLLLYGRDIPTVLQAIQQNRQKFTHVPKGPLGSYMKLKDKKWAVAIEGFLGPSLLGAFACDNSKDSQVLVGIFNRVWTSGRKPMIITSKFFPNKHEVQRNLAQAPHDCISVYNALEIEDPVVSNVIVDQASIENVLLIPSNNRAMELLSNRINVPRNCRLAYTIDGDKFVPDPHYKSYGSRCKRAKYLQVDTKEVMRQLAETIQTLTQKRQTVQNQYTTLAKEVSQQDVEKTKLEEKIRKLMNAKTQIRKKQDELQAAAEPEIANVELLETELAEMKEVLNAKKAAQERIAEEIRELKAAIQENEVQLKRLKNSTSILEDRLETIESERNEASIQLRELNAGEEIRKQRVQEQNSRIIETQASMVVQKEKLQQSLAVAESVGGERQVTRRKVNDISSELMQVQRSTQRMANQNENIDELNKLYLMMRNRFSAASEVLKHLNTDLNELRAATDKRKRHYRLTENFHKTVVMHSFKKVLKCRQFTGTLEINTPEKRLDMVVVPQQGSQGVSTTANLSGGERSFSTVSFLYALWQCMEFPFYFLDEFDVYMDKQNRTKVLDILMHHAQNHPLLQFVFLTPQEVSFINNNVTILRLDDPERRNAA